MVMPVTNKSENLVYEGMGVPFHSEDSNIGKLVSILFSNPPPTDKEGQFTKKNVKNVLAKTSPEYKKLFQEELQRILIYAFENREGVNDELFTLFVHQTVSLFPFAYPDEGFEIQVPVKVNNNWELDTYKLDHKFKLGHQVFMSPMPAYGFTSSTGKHPLLVFMGTTYPAGEGFLGTLISDFTPGISVGGLPSYCGRKELREWLNNNPGAYATGISLGGALSLSAAKHFEENISKVFAYVPPGFNRRELKSFKNSKTQINLLFQEGDIVSTLGYFPEGENIKLYHIYEKEKSNCLSSHARVFLSSENVKVCTGSIKYENQRTSRKILTLLHKILSPLIFLCLVPGYFVSSLYKLVSRSISHIKSNKFPPDFINKSLNIIKTA